jgi:hypothetical protein
MTEHLTRLVVDRRAAELAGAADLSRLARDARAARPPGRSVRASAARVLVALATRLDDRLTPPVPLHHPC